ncbi:porin [Grimontia sp. SpTr1]|uniref:porin n=1 Tax=Grimontia sp. SpTr1 TaxID=2995319 RepID=UPI00248B14E3|nr:porin [Grimontia sp. SpTr1]
MEKRSTIFKVSALTAAILGVVAMPAQAATESAAGDQYVEKLNEFLSGASLSAVAISDTRIRQTDTGDGFDAAFNYSDWNLGVNFASGYTGGETGVGVDLGGYLSGTLYEQTSNCSEIVLCDGWGSQDTNGSFKATKVALKFNTGSVRGDIGLTQMGVGTIGNVWSFVPGTYRGGKAFVDLNGWTLGYGFADQHTAPWWETVQRTPQGKQAFDFLHSVGLVGAVGDVSVDLGVGQANLTNSGSDDSSTSYAAKFNYAADGWSLGYGIYAVNDDSTYDGLGAHHGIQFAMPLGSVKWDSQVRYTHTKNAAEFTPRTVRGYGTNNGTWQQWWDALSDWNQDSQIAWYNRFNFDLGDGWFAYAGVALSDISEEQVAWDAEYAVNGTIGYSVPNGALKGSTIRFHATHLERDMRDNSDWARQDFRLQVIVPYNFL